MQRKFKKRLPTAWGYVSKLFLLPLSVRALSLVPRTTLTRNRLRPLWCLWRPLILPSIHLCPSKTLLSSWSSVVICALIARGKLKPELEFQAGTSCSYHAYISTRILGMLKYQRITCTLRGIQGEATKSLRIQWSPVFRCL